MATTSTQKTEKSVYENARRLMEFRWSEAVPASVFEPDIPSDYTPLRR